MANLETANNFAYHVGRRVGPYKLEGLLGRGAMAEVYKSTHPNLNRDVAVKILHPFHTQVPGFIQRFRHEAQAAASLHHSNIVQVYDFSVSEDGLYYMVMQYINGLSLEEYITLEKKPLSLTKTFHFFRQIANGLSFAHQLDTIHRDVKPANIMLDTRENAYLSDFGLAKIIGVTMQTQSGLGPGTPDYMAPEQVEGKNLSAAADIYAMGVILYRMLTKNLPYSSESWITTIKQKTSEPPIPPRDFVPTIPWSVENIILQALERDPADRFPDVASMLAALETAVADELGEVPGLTRAGMMGVVPLPGVTIENYKIKREFTRDSAKIYQRYLAHNVALDSLAVLNVLKTPADDESSFMKDFHSRMDAVTLIDHTGIAAITRVDVTKDNQPYIAYEYVPGNSLELEIAAWKRQESFPKPVESLTLIKGIAEALKVAHEANIIHNDLRPENIVLNEGQIPVIVGLEIPVAPDYLTISRNSNTVDYASPEQLNGGTLLPSSNIYSLGIMLYHLLAGERPRIPLSWDWSDEDLPRGVPLDHAVDGLTPDTYKLVECCIQELPESRYPNLPAMLADLELAIKAEEKNKWSPPVVTPEGEMDQTVRGRRLWLAAVPVALLLLIPLFFVVRDQVFGANAAVITPTSESTTQSTEPTTIVVSVPENPTESPTPLFAGQRVQTGEPHAGATLSTENEVTFRWQWPHPLEAGQSFAVYLLEAGEEMLLGTVSEPNENGRYRLTDQVTTPGIFNWQVRLEDSATQEVLAQSPQIGILFQDPTSVPTPTATIRPSRTPTGTAVTTECIPPEGWVEYTVQPGDTLFNIALATGSTVEEVRQANCMESNVLSVGALWVAQLPPTATPTPTDTPPPTVTEPPFRPQPQRTNTPAPPTSEPTATIPPPPSSTPEPSATTEPDSSPEPDT